MKTKITLVAISLGLLVMYSCDDKTHKLKSNNSLSKYRLEKEKKLSHKFEHIPNSFFLEKDLSKKKTKNLSNPNDKKLLDLPQDFTSRDFLTNTVGYKSNLELLAGMVVRKDKITNSYTIIRDYKKDTVLIAPRVPSNGILVEKKYDSKIGGAISYILTSAQIDRNSAYQFTISDISEITLSDSYIDIKKLARTYKNDKDINDYYLIKAAVTTSVLYKKYSKIDGKIDFSAGAIKIDSKYYSEDSDLKQDWKVGVQLTPIQEYLKGFDSNKN